MNTYQEEIGLNIRDYSFIENFIDDPEGFLKHHEKRACNSRNFEFFQNMDNAKEATENCKNWEDWVYDESEGYYWAEYWKEYWASAE